MDDRQTAAEAPILIDARQAARLLGICERTLFSFTRSGELRCVRIGRRVLYRPGDLCAFAERKAVQHDR